MRYKQSSAIIIFHGIQICTTILSSMFGTTTALVAFDYVDRTKELNDVFDNYRCFENNEPQKNSLQINSQLSIGLEVSDRATHQLMSRIFLIFLQEVLQYRNIALIPIQYGSNIDEPEKLWQTLEQIRFNKNWPDMNMINLEVWVPAIRFYKFPEYIHEAGASTSPGRFGWFVREIKFPKALPESLHYNVFRDNKNVYYENFLMKDEELNALRKLENVEEYRSSKCVNLRCVTLLAEFKEDSSFIKKEIEESESYLNVLWLGPNFKKQVESLHNLYEKENREKNFVVLHWTPSELIDGSCKFEQITMPRCEEFPFLRNSGCKYELTPLLKYYFNALASDRRLMHALHSFYIDETQLHKLQMDLNKMLIVNTANSSDEIYNHVACNWLKNNANTYSRWTRQEPKMKLAIGGIFPITMNNRGHQNLVDAVQLAVDAINNSTVLANYELEVQTNDGQCKADMVMKAFIHYFNVPKMLGVLGPACSETVEPIAGISKHMNMAVISYSAEGATFVDRNAYPLFFRTIGTNRQYEDVYISLMKRLNWHRVAALTEDGQKYTEYISYMEAKMKKHNLELILNRKFLSDVTATGMNKVLLDLKAKHAKIIIADIHNKNAELALCEATKLGMTAKDGYVWFLPSWLSKDWQMSHIASNDSCSTKELSEAFEGHFTIMHTPFGKLTTKMQEGITVDDWLKNYKIKNKTLSSYIGFAYDAVWVYALAADKLLRENKDAINGLRSKVVAKRFAELIWDTDFDGLSGRVRFGQGGSRITELNILQWHGSHFEEIGKYFPDTEGSGETLHPVGGELQLNEAKIKWMSGSKPGDGRYDCSFSSLAQLMDTDCEKAAMIFAVTICISAVLIVSLVSFLFWKKRYDTKLKRSAKIMKNFGIDLLSPSRNNLNTLDKWEIPKENVVINRRLGEGAFGTVYGGEAKFGEDGWSAVAVKTLKAGASTEDRLDFLSEAEAMKRFDHKNIVKLLGVCLQSEPIYTIMEFMLYGDLKTYLLARRNMVNEKQSDESDISPKRLTMYAMDVVRGLSYLAQQKYVHRDLACRNCLVNAQRVVKLGDFGMARPTFESDYYRFNRKGMLPVRWMAPESLALGMFTPASDVWAFGVILFEIMTFGSYPYQGLTNNQVLEHVKAGNTLPIPSGVKPHLEGLIKACWSQEPKKRPTASEIIDYISNYPRLLTPSLDFPGAAVEMPETESDQLELLPKIRKSSPPKRDTTLDILSRTTTATNDFDKYNNFINDSNLSHNDVTFAADERTSMPLSSIDIISPITPDGYSIMSPLLMHQVSDSSDVSQTTNHLLKKSPCLTLDQTPF